jgi:hypothetical protein
MSLPYGRSTHSPARYHLSVTKISETALYAPIKAFLEEQGFEVRGEVQGCDVVGTRGEDVVVVELKTAMNLTLVLQGVDRLAMTDLVYLAIPAPKRAQMVRWSETIQLCRRLGLGLLTVRPGARLGPKVEIAAEPIPYSPRKAKARRERLLREFRARSGDHNTGGAARETRITAYRESALLMADELRRVGPSAPRDLRRATGCARARDILANNYYGWFVRESPGVYAVTAEGVEALDRFEDVLATARDRHEAGGPDA